MARKPPPGDDGVGISEDQLEAMFGARAALAELTHAEDEARRAEQLREHQRLRQRTLFFRLVRKRSAWLRQLTARLVGNRDADDVAQETLVSLMKWLRRHPLPQGIALLDSPQEVEALLFTMAARRAYDVLRRRRELLTGSGGEIEQTAHAPAVAPELGLELEELTAAYRTLKPLQRIAHVLHHRYGLTDTELAVKLGITRTGSRTLVCRANRALKRAMETKS